MNNELQKENQPSKGNVSSGEPTIVLSGFEILDVLGTGGMSTVYKARQEHMERLVAIKVLHRYLAQDAVHLQRFRQEARLSTVLDHPNIASLYSFGTSDQGQPYLVMEYCVGETLKELMDKTHTFSWSQIQEIFDQVLSGMAHAHLHGVIHRDLKPANIFISHDDNDKLHVKIIDFGIAKLEATATGDAQKLTKTGLVIGSPHYMSPEQCQSQKVDARSDIYALGCMLYEMISGQLPFGGQSTLEIANKHVSETATSMSQVSSLRIHSALEKLVAKAMAKKPEDRFQSVQEFQGALAAISTNSVRGSRKNRPEKRKLSVKSLLKAAVFCAIPLIAVVMFFQSKSLDPQSVPLAAAENVLNESSYEKAMPLLLKLQNTPLNDADATRLVNALVEVASMYRQDSGNTQVAGEAQCIVAADAAAEPTANHPSKFSMCRAQLLEGELYMGTKLEHVMNILDLNGLSDTEKEYCLGRIAYIKTQAAQGRGRFSEAGVEYLRAISHYTKAHAIPELEWTYFAQANLYSDGEHVLENQQSWDSAYQYLPELMKCDSRLAARDLVAMTNIYLNGHMKYDEAKAALKRAGEVYAKTKGGHKEMSEYFMAQGNLELAMNPQNPDYLSALNWFKKGYNERCYVRVEPEGLLYDLLQIADCQKKLKHPNQAVDTLKLTLPIIDSIVFRESKLSSGIGVYTAMAEALDDAGRDKEALQARQELLHYLKASSKLLRKKLAATRIPADAAQYHGITFAYAALSNRLGDRKAAQQITADEVANILQTVGPCRSAVDATLGQSYVQDTMPEGAACVEKALHLMEGIAKTPDDLNYVLRIKANLGVAYQQLGQLDKAMPLLLEVEEACNKPKATRADWEVFTPFALANAYMQQGKTSEAMAIYQKIMPKLKPKQYEGQPVVTQARQFYSNL